MEVIHQLSQLLKHHKELSNKAFTAADFQHIPSAIHIEDPNMNRLLPESGHYYYLYDTVSHEIVYVSESIESILGITREEFNLKTLFKRVHHEDRRHILASEVLFCQFFSSHISQSEYTSYTTSYCFRVFTASGECHLALHQGIAYDIDRNGFIRYMLYVDRLIEHSVVNNSMLVSFRSKNGSPSYLGIDPYNTTSSISPVTFVFTKREEEILRLLSKGLTAEKIAETLHVSFNTIRTHKQNLLRKAGVRNSIELVAMAIKMGIL